MPGIKSKVWSPIEVFESKECGAGWNEIWAQFPGADRSIYNDYRAEFAGCVKPEFKKRKGSKGKILGHWKSSPVASDEDKHAVLGFISSLGQCRYGTQHYNMEGRPIPKASQLRLRFVELEDIVLKDFFTTLDPSQIQDVVGLRLSAQEQDAKRGTIWSPDDDALLVKHVQLVARMSGSMQWSDECVPGRSAESCRSRYRTLGCKAAKDGLVGGETKQYRAPNGAIAQDILNEPASSPPKQTRTPISNVLSERKSERQKADTEERPSPQSGCAKSKVSLQNEGSGVKHVFLGQWKYSPVPDQKDKHAVIGFIDAQDNLRRYILPKTITGEDVPSEYPLPARPNARWVASKDVVLIDHLVGLSKPEVKEYVILCGQHEATTKERLKSIAEAVRGVRPVRKKPRATPANANAAAAAAAAADAAVAAATPTTNGRIRFHESVTQDPTKMSSPNVDGAAPTGDGPATPGMPFGETCPPYNHNDSSSNNSQGLVSPQVARGYDITSTSLPSFRELEAFAGFDDPARTSTPLQMSRSVSHLQHTPSHYGFGSAAIYPSAVLARSASYHRTPLRHHSARDVSSNTTFGESTQHPSRDLDPVRLVKENPMLESRTTAPAVVDDADLTGQCLTHYVKRRRLNGGLADINPAPANGKVTEQHPLGQNNMFPVKVVRETRDGRFVDGNFLLDAGALWIPYEGVEF